VTGTHVKMKRQIHESNWFPPEKKFFDYGFGLPIPSTGTVAATSINLIERGDGETNRNGYKINLESIHIKILATYVPANTVTKYTAHVCLYLVQDMQCNGTGALYSDVFNIANTLMAHTVLANKDRFKLWKKWIFKLKPTTIVVTKSTTSGSHTWDYTDTSTMTGTETGAPPTVATAGTWTTAGSTSNSTMLSESDGLEYQINQDVHYEEWYQKLDIPILFSPNTGALNISNVKSNNLFLIMYQYGADSDVVILSVSSRLRFIDV